MEATKNSTLGEINREFWDENADELFRQEWVQVLGHQLTALLRDNVGSMDLRKPDADDAPLKMLDYACGFGMASIAMSPYVGILRGMDISQTMVDRYNEAALKSGFTREQMSAIRGDVLGGDGDAEMVSAEFYDFDVVIESMALHHVADHQSLVTKMVDRLRPGGVVAIIDWPPSQQMSDHLGQKLEVRKTIHGQNDFSEEYMTTLFVEAGCSPSSVRYVLHSEESVIPEAVTKIKGGMKRTAFLAWAQKAGAAA